MRRPTTARDRCGATVQHASPAGGRTFTPPPSKPDKIYRRSAIRAGNFGIEPLTGTSEIVVEDGAIQSSNFSWSEATLAALQAAPFVAREDLIGTWYVGSFMELRENGTCRGADKQADLQEPVGEAHPGSQEEWT